MAEQWALFDDFGDPTFTVSVAPASEPASPPPPDARPGPVAAAAVHATAPRMGARGELYAPPSGAVSRAQANLEALRLVKSRPPGHLATAEEMEILARWSGWGALPNVFDEGAARVAKGLLQVREAVRGLMSAEEWRAARATTMNAHYTSPEVAEAIWSRVEDLGLAGVGRRVLEPGCGIGVFMAAAPDGVDIVGVEKDPITARICQMLHPDQTVKHTGFENYQPDSQFDVVIGNVPFGDYPPFDPIYNADKHSIHDYFVHKGLQLLRPGGLLGVVTSSYTLDSKDDSARRRFDDLAEFVGAVRLPNTTFVRQSGTRVTTDIVFFSRRSTEVAYPGERHSIRLWRPLGTNDGGLPVSQWYVNHPEQILGTLVKGSMYGDDEGTQVEPDSDDPLGPRLEEAVAALPPPSAPTPMVGAVPAAATEERDPGAGLLPAWAKVGSILAAGEGEFVQVTPTGVEPYRPRGRAPEAGVELAAILRVRDAVAELLQAESRADGDGALPGLRKRLNTVYEEYVAEYGPITRVDVDSGRKSPPWLGGFAKMDPDAWVVRSVEDDFDPETGVATKGQIFRGRRVHPPPPDPETIDDAIARSVWQTGYVSLPLMESWGFDQDTVIGSELCFEDPVSGQWQSATKYLAGNVRKKLTAARAAAGEDDRFSRNVKALTDVVPTELVPSEISGGIGAPWLTPDEVYQFAVDTLGPTGCEALKVAWDPLTGWSMEGHLGWQKNSVVHTDEYGTPRQPALRVLEGMLRNRSPRVDKRVTTPDGKKRTEIDVDETLAVLERRSRWEAAFDEWAWEKDPTRAADLTERYNRRYNGYVTPEYEPWPDPPGLRADFKLRPAQRQAVARIINDGDFLLGHSVGAGKTAIMVSAAMEMRRLGLVEKPMAVVPKHLVNQFAQDARELYPGRKVLAATSNDVNPAYRAEFAAKCREGDWDLVVMTQPAFTSLNVTPETDLAYQTAAIDALRSALENTVGKRVKDIEKQIARKEAKLRETFHELRALRDRGVYWEDLGVDYLFMDESHMYKNVGVNSSFMGRKGSSRANDFQMKLSLLREARPGLGAVTLASGTPIANSISEVFVNQQYLQPDTLEESGVRHYDSWFRQFGKERQQLELAPAGNKWRVSTRPAAFRNVPEMMGMLAQNAHIAGAEELGLSLPDVADGAPRTVVVPPSQQLVEYIEYLGDRAEMVAMKMVEPDEDNMLKITTDGRKAALDPRMVGLPPAEETVTTACATQVARVWQETKDRSYTRHQSAAPNPQLGGFQMVFLDMGVPRGATLNLYEDLADALVERGMPRERIEFVQDYETDDAKADLFERCREGDVSVLVGSTERMGVGTNVQTRAVAIHHLSPPWRPADIEQRDGRVLRVGNQNPEVEVFRYATERSFDIFMWQTLERKAAFIAQASAGGKGLAREIEDVDDLAVLSYGEVKAAVSGNPLLMEIEDAKTDLSQWRQHRRGWERDRRRLTNMIRARTDRVAANRERVKVLDVLEDERDPDDSRAYIQRYSYGGGRTSSWEQMSGKEGWDNRLWATACKSTHYRYGEDREPIGYVGGLPVKVTKRVDHSSYRWYDKPAHWEFQVGPAEAKLTFAVSATMEEEDKSLPRLAKRLGNLVERIPAIRAEALAEIERDTEQIAKGSERLSGDYPKQDLLDAAAARLEALEEQQATETGYTVHRDRSEATESQARVEVTAGVGNRTEVSSEHPASPNGAAADSTEEARQVFAEEIGARIAAGVSVADAIELLKRTKPNERGRLTVEF